jgi:hypothetical protein
VPTKNNKVKVKIAKEGDRISTRNIEYQMLVNPGLNNEV